MKIYVGPATYLQGKVRVPPSKNYTSRYIWVSALTEGESVLVNPADNDDAQALLACCRQLGADFRWEKEKLWIKGFGPNPRPPGVLDPGNGGLILRLVITGGLALTGSKICHVLPGFIREKTPGRSFNRLPPDGGGG